MNNETGDKSRTEVNNVSKALDGLLKDLHYLNNVRSYQEVGRNAFLYVELIWSIKEYMKSQT